MNMPSLSVIIISTLAFVLALRFIKRQLNDIDVNSGATQGLLALTLATFVALSAGKVVDWISDKVNSPKATTVKQINR